MIISSRFPGRAEDQAFKRNIHLLLSHILERSFRALIEHHLVGKAYSLANPIFLCYDENTI